MKGLTDHVNNFESSIIVDLARTTLGCGVILRKFKQLMHAIDDCH
ncbi:MAG: hypothetical protein ACTS8H_01890 [Arsenophonus sp. NC-PE1-MAG3]